MIYKIGELIAQRRKELHMTQEELSSGICEASTLSKIENGQHFPTKERLDALLQRLGLDANCYNAYVSVAEFELHELMYLAKQQIANSELENAEKTLSLLATKAKRKSRILQQFILYNEIILGNRKVGYFSEYTDERLLEELIKALRYTLPSIDLDEINNYYLTIQEITILNSIANWYYKTNNRKKALYLYDQILRYVQRHCMLMQDAAHIIPLITYNYSRVLILRNHFEEALDVSQIGCAYCKDYQKTSLIGQLLYNKAYCLLELHHENSSDAYEILKQAYHILRLYDYDELANQIQEEAKVKWNIIIS